MSNGIVADTTQTYANQPADDRQNRAWFNFADCLRLVDVVSPYEHAQWHGARTTMFLSLSTTNFAHFLLIAQYVRPNYELKS